MKPEGALKAQALAKLARRFDALEARLSDGRDHLTGDRFTVADAYAFVVASWAGLIGFDLSRHPRVQDYVARVAARPKVREVLRREGLAA